MTPSAVADLSAPGAPSLLDAPAPAIQPVAAPAKPNAPPSPHRYLLQALLATCVVALVPTLVVWWLRSSGALRSYPLGAALGMALSLGAAYGGRAFWQTRPGSKDVLFGELMLWGYLVRCYRERRLRSASATLGLTSQAQLSMPDGLSREQQVKLLEDLAGALDARDTTTHGHSRRVARYAWIIAERMGLPPEQVARVRTAAAVHDLGKVLTPTAILRKPGALTDEEYEVMKRHAADGARMAAALHDPAITEMVRDHHERLDGSGYPSHRHGEEVPLGARIIAVADTFDAMVADRPYRRSIALWSSLTTIPSRLASLLGSGAGGIASGVKAVAIAALVGGLASSTATLVRPASREPSAPVSAQAAQAVSPTARGTVSSTPTTAGTRRSQHAGAVAISKRTTSPHGGATAPSATVSPATVAASTSGSSVPAATQSADTRQPASSTSGEARSVGQHHSGESEAAVGRDEGTSAPASTSSPGAPEARAGKGKEDVKEVAEGVRGKVEEAKGKVEGTTKAVEETSGKVQETTKGTVEETTGRVGKVLGRP